MHRQKQIDFIGTDFGFGPVSKLVVVAETIRDFLPDVKLRLIGSGNVFEFGRRSHVFDEVIPVNLDAEPGKAADLTKEAAAIFDCLNFQVLPFLVHRKHKVYFVDSLAWMWGDISKEIALTEKYFVQGFLSSEGEDRNCVPERCLKTGPIIHPGISRFKDQKRDKEKAVISLGGCYNPFVPPKYLVNYAIDVVRSALACLPPRFSNVSVYTNTKIAHELRNRIPDADILIKHAEHHTFLREIASCGLLLTTPGITTTLECIALETPLKYLPPNNFSQYRILNIYHNKGILSEDIRLERFFEDAVIPPETDEEVAVKKIGKILSSIKEGEFGNLLEPVLKKSIENYKDTHELKKISNLPYSQGSGSLEIAREVIQEID
jgi:hypothetical protein